MNDNQNVDASGASPTRVRYAVVGVTSLMAVLLYLDRFCLSFAEIFIKQEMGLADWQIGWLLGAFFLTYALAQVPSGWLTDRFGSRSMLCIYVLAWSLFTGLIGLAAGFWALLALRLGLGLAQAGAYPTGANIISKWVPFRVRGTASSVVAMGGRIGGVMALSVTGYLIVWLTPASTPAVLTAEDVLEGPELCRELLDNATAEEVRETGRKVLEALGEDLQQVVQRHASPAETTDRVEGQSVADELPAAVLSQLTAGLNRIINQPVFFTAAEVARLSPEKEALRLSNRESLSEQQNQRLNRLVLEALHRNSVRKLYVAGWRPMMITYGTLGIFVAALIWWISRDSPTEHPRCNRGELALIGKDARMKATQGRAQLGNTPVLLRRLVSSLSMWLDCLGQLCTNVGWVFVLTWAPRYLEEVHHVPVEQRALMAMLPPLLGSAGMLLGGGLTDVLVRIIGLRWGRALPMSLSRFLAMSAYVVCLFQPSVWLAVAMFSLVSFATNLGTAAGWAFKQDVGGKYVGSVLGWGNMFGNLGAFFTPPLLIWIVGDSQNWTSAFVTCAAAFFVAGIAYLGINATIQIAPEDAEDRDPGE